jgi:dolichol kinase
MGLYGQSAQKSRGDSSDGEEMEASSAISSKKSPLIIVAASLLSLCIGGAYTGILPGYTTGDGIVVPSLILHDVGMTFLAAVLGFVFVKINTLAVKAGKLDPSDARKLIHSGAAPLFILFWPGFETRFFAAIIPMLNALRLYLAANDSGSELAAAVSRSGDIKEALGGPFIYVIMIIACLLIFWTSSPIGVVALCTLAAGDGLADLVGRRWGKSNPWPGLGSKSVAGTMAFWLASTAVSYGILMWLQYTNCLVLDVDNVLLRLAAVTFVSAIVELIPFLDDNYTVPISAAAMAAVLLQ